MKKLALRDLAIFTLMLIAWRVDLRFQESGAIGLAIAIATGVLTALVGFLMHEWGHLVASLASGSKVDFSPRLFSPLLFHFDSAQNDRRQFFWMSTGGYVASLAGLALIVSLCPLSTWAGRIALAFVGLGVLATFTLELPITWRVWRGAALPLGKAYRPHGE